jgi:hypothetical protein
MKIVSITTKQNKNFTIGHSPDHLDEGVVISRIVYKRPGNLFNKGFQNNESCYVVYQEGSSLGRIVPEREVTEIMVDPEESGKKQDSEAPSVETFLGTTE